MRFSKQTKPHNTIKFLKFYTSNSNTVTTMVKQAAAPEVKKSYFEMILSSIRKANTRGKGITLPVLKKQVAEENGGTVHLPTFKRTLSLAIQNGMVEHGLTKMRFLVTQKARDAQDEAARQAKAKLKAKAKKATKSAKKTTRSKKKAAKSKKKATKKRASSKPKKTIKKASRGRGRPKKASKGRATKTTRKSTRGKKASRGRGRKKN